MTLLGKIVGTSLLRSAKHEVLREEICRDLIFSSQAAVTVPVCNYIHVPVTHVVLKRYLLNH